jgi:hypothetical protein
MGEEQVTSNAEVASAKTEASMPKTASKKRGRKPGKKSKKSATKRTAKADDIPIWQKMGWKKPGRKRGNKASTAKGSKQTKSARATPAVRKALARTGTTIAAGSDVRSLLVAAIKQAVDTADYENARQILQLLEKQKR